MNVDVVFSLRVSLTIEELNESRKLFAKQKKTNIIRLEITFGE